MKIVFVFVTLILGIGVFLLSQVCEFYNKDGQKTQVGIPLLNIEFALIGLFIFFFSIVTFWPKTIRNIRREIKGNSTTDSPKTKHTESPTIENKEIRKLKEDLKFDYLKKK